MLAVHTKPRSRPNVVMKYIIPFLFLISSCLCEVEFSSRSRNFSIELLYFTQSEAEGHIVISPFGIWTLMTGVALGSTGNSYMQVRRAFILPKNQTALIQGYKELTKSVLNPTTHGVTLTSKNYVFLDDDFTINPGFRGSVQSDFDASVKVIDFNDPNAAARIANNYIQTSGGGRVSNVLKSEDFAESRMILTNVISFKGLWTYPFNKTETTRKPFFDENRRKVGEVNMMYQRGPFRFSNMQDLQAFVVELPYGDDNKYSMLVILPYNRIKLMDMYKNFAKVSLVDVVQKLSEDEEEFGGTDVDVEIPRMKISTNVVLNKPLNSMGVYDIFEPDLASFEKVSKDKIFVSAIVHKADIEITESGTVAAAATSAVFADRISTPHFEANRPFVYFVVEMTTTTVIFGGIYSKPTVY